MIFRLKTFLTPFLFLSAFCVFLPHASLGSEAKGPGGTVFGIHVLPAGYKLPDNVHDWDPISGSVNNYHVPQVRAQVNAEIQQLYQTGQRRSRLFLWHRRDALAPEDAPNRVIGTVLKSLGGDFSPQVMENLQDILKTMHATGFQEIEIVFGAVGQNYPFWWYDRLTAGQPLPIPHDNDADGVYDSLFMVPPGCQANVYPGDFAPADAFPFPCHELWRGSATEWTTGPDSNEDYYQENWNVIYNVWPVLKEAAAGMIVRVDLCPECEVPTDDNPAHYESGHAGDLLYHLAQGKRALYTLRLWVDFNLNFSKSDTVGFSIISGTAEQVDAAIRGAYQIYDRTILGRPYLIDQHIYHAPERNMSAAQQLQQMDRTLKALGDYHTGVIVGESYTNDPDTAVSLNNSGVTRTIWYLCQFLFVRHDNPDGTNGDHFFHPNWVTPYLPIVPFNQYRQYGF